MSFSRQQWRVLIVLMLVNFCNYVDRQIVFPLFPLIRGEFTLTYFQVGSLAAAFSIVHALATLPFGILADRTSRKKIISYALFFWSGATFFSGLAGSFRTLLATRALVGVGEAAYSPSATAIITGTFGKNVRARVQGLFDSGMFVGGALGLALGGIIGQAVGWRPAFFLVGIPGLLLGLSIFRIPEPPHASEERVPLKTLLKIPAYVMILIGGWFITFAAHAYIIWTMEFVYRYKGFSLREAGMSMGVLTLVTGVIGIGCGAALADFLTKRYSFGRIAVVPMAFLTSAPFVLLALEATSKTAVLALFSVGIFFGTWYHGPVTATVHDLTPPQAHATAMGLYYMFVNLFATSAAPLVIGWIGDRFGLLTGMKVAIAAQVIGALCFIGVAVMIGCKEKAKVSLRSEPVIGELLDGTQQA